jgi:hypothetical protein
MPLFDSKLKQSDFQPIVDKFVKKDDVWKVPIAIVGCHCWGSKQKKKIPMTLTQDLSYADVR